MMSHESGLLVGRKKTASIGYCRTIEPLLASDRQIGTRVAKAHVTLHAGVFRGQFVVRNPGRTGCECGVCVSFSYETLRADDTTGRRSFELALLELAHAGAIFTQGV